MPNKKAKERKRKRIMLNKQLQKEGRTSKQRAKKKLKGGGSVNSVRRF